MKDKLDVKCGCRPTTY